MSHSLHNHIDSKQNKNKTPFLLCKLPSVFPIDPFSSSHFSLSPSNITTQKTHKIKNRYPHFFHSILILITQPKLQNKNRELRRRRRGRRRKSKATMAVSTIYSTQSLNSTHFLTSSPSSSSSTSKHVFFYRRNQSQTNRRCNTIITCAQQTVVIGLAADSGCGKSTFMRRLTSVFGGAAEPPKGGNPDSNTLISDMTTVICLDDYHSLDRTGRKEKGVTALDPRANDFDLMYEQVKALKSGVAVEKPIYNHVTGLLDAPELIQPPKILVIEGLHPM